jgi:hypothetical protein
MGFEFSGAIAEWKIQTLVEKLNSSPEEKGSLIIFSK